MELKLLAINSYYYRRGGAEAVFLEHNRLFHRRLDGRFPFALHLLKIFEMNGKVDSVVFVIAQQSFD